MRMPGASLADFWNYLYAGLNDEYNLVAEVTKALERRCSDRDGLPDDLVPSQVLAELAAQVQMFADTKTLGILSATGSIDVEKESEYLPVFSMARAKLSNHNCGAVCRGV